MNDKEELLKNIKTHIKKLEIQRLHLLKIYKSHGYIMAIKKANFLLYEIKQLKKIIGDF